MLLHFLADGTLPHYLLCGTSFVAFSLVTKGWSPFMISSDSILSVKLFLVAQASFRHLPVSSQIAQSHLFYTILQVFFFLVFPFLYSEILSAENVEEGRHVGRPSYMALSSLKKGYYFLNPCYFTNIINSKVSFA